MTLPGSDVEWRQPVAPEDLRDLTPVMDVMLQHVPDDPAATTRPSAALDGDLEVVGRPTPQTVVDEAPGTLETIDELRSRPRTAFVVFPAGVLDGYAWTRRAIDPEHDSERGLAFAEHVVEPTRTRARDVAGQLPHGPLMWRRPQRELLECEVTERRGQECA